MDRPNGAEWDERGGTRKKQTQETTMVTDGVEGATKDESLVTWFQGRQTIVRRTGWRLFLIRAPEKTKIREMETRFGSRRLIFSGGKAVFPHEPLGTLDARGEGRRRGGDSRRRRRKCIINYYCIDAESLGGQEAPRRF